MPGRENDASDAALVQRSRPSDRPAPGEVLVRTLRRPPNRDSLSSAQWWSELSSGRGWTT